MTEDQAALLTTQNALMIELLKLMLQELRHISRVLEGNR